MSSVRFLCRRYAFYAVGTLCMQSLRFLCNRYAL